MQPLNIGGPVVHGALTQKILRAAVEVHRRLGPGLLESAYRACLARELQLDALEVRQEVAVPLEYKGLRLDAAYRADLIVQDLVIVELKCVETIRDVHKAQALTYLRLTGLRVALILNFNVPSLRRGIVRLIR